MSREIAGQTTEAGACETSCTRAQNLCDLTSPLEGISADGFDTVFTDCGSGMEKVVYADIPAGVTITIELSNTSFVNNHELWWGGTCPGDTRVGKCRYQYPDQHTRQRAWTNDQGSTQRVYLIVSTRKRYVVDTSFQRVVPGYVAWHASYRVFFARGGGARVLRRGCVVGLALHGHAYGIHVLIVCAGKLGNTQHQNLFEWIRQCNLNFRDNWSVRLYRV